MLLQPKDYNNRVETSHIFQSSQYEIYRTILSNVYCSRFSWSSPEVTKKELDKIEQFLFIDGQCVLLRPYRLIANVRIYEDWVVLRVSSINFDRDNVIPLTVTTYDQDYINIYPYNEFILIKDFYSHAIEHVCMSAIAHEYALKLSQIDAAIENNLKKQRLPVLFKTNKGAFNTIKSVVSEGLAGGFYAVVDNKSLMNDAGEIYETLEIPVTVNELLNAKNRVLQEYSSILGIVNSQDYNETAAYINSNQIEMNKTFVKNVAKTQLMNRKNFSNLRLSEEIKLEVTYVSE